MTNQAANKLQLDRKLKNFSTPGQPHHHDRSLNSQSFHNSNGKKGVDKISDLKEKTETRNNTTPDDNNKEKDFTGSKNDNLDKAGNLDNSIKPTVYNATTDTDFYMFEYKTKCCKKSPCVNMRACIYYHHELERRRSPKLYRYSAEPCSEVKFSGTQNNLNKWHDPNRCEKLDFCPFSHTLLEQMYHPHIYKTSLCSNHILSRREIASRQKCMWGNMCTHAHGKHELRQRKDLTKIYLFEDKGDCSRKGNQKMGESSKLSKVTDRNKSDGTNSDVAGERKEPMSFSDALRSSLLNEGKKKPQSETKKEPKNIHINTNKMAQKSPRDSRKSADRKFRTRDTPKGVGKNSEKLELNREKHGLQKECQNYGENRNPETETNCKCQKGSEFSQNRSVSSDFSAENAMNCENKRERLKESEQKNVQKDAQENAEESNNGSSLKSLETSGNSNENMDNGRNPKSFEFDSKVPFSKDGSRNRTERKMEHLFMKPLNDLESGNLAFRQDLETFYPKDLQPNEVQGLNQSFMPSQPMNYGYPDIFAANVFSDFQSLSFPFPQTLQNTLDAAPQMNSANHPNAMPLSQKVDRLNPLSPPPSDTGRTNVHLFTRGEKDEQKSHLRSPERLEDKDRGEHQGKPRGGNGRRPPRPEQRSAKNCENSKLPYKTPPKSAEKKQKSAPKTEKSSSERTDDTIETKEGLINVKKYFSPVIGPNKTAVLRESGPAFELPRSAEEHEFFERGSPFLLPGNLLFEREKAPTISPKSLSASLHAASAKGNRQNTIQKAGNGKNQGAVRFEGPQTLNKNYSPEVKVQDQNMKERISPRFDPRPNDFIGLKTPNHSNGVFEFEGRKSPKHLLPRMQPLRIVRDSPIFDFYGAPKDAEAPSDPPERPGRAQNSKTFRTSRQDKCPENKGNRKCPRSTECRETFKNYRSFRKFETLEKCRKHGGSKESEFMENSVGRGEKEGGTAVRGNALEMGDGALRWRHEEAKNSQMCTSCEHPEKTRDSVVVPCGHFMCSKCAEDSKKAGCLKCNKKCETVVKLRFD